VITHLHRGSTAACTARVRGPWLTRDAELVDCGNCRRTRAWRDGVAGAAPADRAVLLDLVRRLGRAG
jgi:hypothetical protein